MLILRALNMSLLERILFWIFNELICKASLNYYGSRCNVVTQILGENRMASTGGILSTHASHSGRWYIVSCECVNKSTIITFPHHLLQISSADPPSQLGNTCESFKTRHFSFSNTELCPSHHLSFTVKTHNCTAYTLICTVVNIR